MCFVDFSGTTFPISLVWNAFILAHAHYEIVDIKLAKNSW